MSDILIVVNRNNADHNTFPDIVAAVRDTGASVIVTDEELFTIEANAPAGAVATITAMEGVSYVRCLFSYLCEEPTPVQAA